MCDDGSARSIGALCKMFQSPAYLTMRIAAPLLAGALLLLAASLPLASPRARRWILGTTQTPDLEQPEGQKPAQEEGRGGRREALRSAL